MSLKLGFLMACAASISILGLVSCGPEAKSPPIDFKVRPLNPGGDLALSTTFKDKPVVVYLWATWCGPCKEFAPTLNTMADEYQPKGIGFIAISDENPMLVRSFEAKEPHRMTVATDERGNVSDVIKTAGLPTVVILNKKHEIVFQQTGVNEATEIQMRALLNEL